MHDGSQTWEDWLYNWLQSVHNAGLQPVVAFTPSDGKQNNYNGTTDPPAPTSANDDRIRCAYYYTLYASYIWGVPITYFEAWNEPDLCPGGGPGYCGDAPDAANLWNQEDWEVNMLHSNYPSTTPSPAAFPVAATISGMECFYHGQGDGHFTCPNGTDEQGAWLDNYMAHLNVMPFYWGLHDYEDVTAGGANGALFQNQQANFTRFKTFIHNWYGTWSFATEITETAGRLIDRYSYTGDGTWVGCPGETDNSYTVGACVDQSRQTDARTAEQFKWLASQPGVDTIFWHGLGPQYGSWDSELTDISDAPRASFCVLAFGENDAQATFDTANCPGSSYDLGDANGL